MNKFELFSQSFEDNEIYTDFYFNRRKNSVKSFEEIIDHNTIALVNVADIIICNDKVQYKTALITGVCTAPQMRKKGVMHKLLSNVLDQLKDEYQLAILSPENDNYYKKYNFKSLVIGDWINIEYKQNKHYSYQNPSKIDTKLLLEIYNNVANNYSTYQKIDNNIIEDLINEYALDNINISIAYKENQPIGWYIIENDKVVYSVLPDTDILNYLVQDNDIKYFKYNISGSKEIFQIAYLDNKITPFEINSAFILNRY